MTPLECKISPDCLFMNGHEYACSDVVKSSPEVEYATPEAKQIVEVILPQMVELFVEKNAKYQAVRGDLDLGAKGMFPDINRKIAVLRTRIWDGIETPGENTTEVIYDTIGHLLLMAERITRP